MWLAGSSFAGLWSRWQFQRPCRNAAGAAPALRGDQARAPLLVAAAADPPGIRGARLAARAVGTGVEQAAAGEAAALHTNPQHSCRFRPLLDGVDRHAQGDDRVVRRRPVRLVEPPAATAVTGDRVRRVLVQLRQVRQLPPPSRDRRVQPGAGRDIRESDCRKATHVIPSRSSSAASWPARHGSNAISRIVSRAASSRITSPASSTASSPWPIQTPPRRSSVTHATAVAERWPPTSTPTWTSSPSAISGAPTHACHAPAAASGWRAPSTGSRRTAGTRERAARPERARSTAAMRWSGGHPTNGSRRRGCRSTSSGRQPLRFAITSPTMKRASGGRRRT